MTYIVYIYMCVCVHLSIHFHYFYWNYVCRVYGCVPMCGLDVCPQREGLALFSSLFPLAESQTLQYLISYQFRMIYDLKNNVWLWHLQIWPNKSRPHFPFSQDPSQSPPRPSPPRSPRRSPRRLRRLPSSSGASVASAAGSGHAAGSSCWGCPGIGRPAAMERPGGWGDF